MSVSRTIRSRLVLAAMMLFASVALAPNAFARGHGHAWSIGFSGPGYSIGYSDCRHCGRSNWGGNYYGGSYVSVYSGYPSYASYGPSYYDSPVYYPSYGTSYRPYYHDRPHRHVTRRVVTREVRYYDDRGHRSSNQRYRNDRDYDRRDRGYERASYYDRGR